MRTFRSRVEDATFELNLAPMLDIIVSIVPMLLLSVTFIQITVVDTPIPQVVEKAIAESQKNEDIQISLAVSKSHGFKITVINKGQTSERKVALKGQDLDLTGLHTEMVGLKQQFPGVFRLELLPDETVALGEIVFVMDQVRTRVGQDPKFYVLDKETGKQIETDLMFPDVVFGNVAGG